MGEGLNMGVEQIRDKVTGQFLGALGTAQSRRRLAKGNKNFIFANSLCRARGSGQPEHTNDTGTGLEVYLLVESTMGIRAASGQGGPPALWPLTPEKDRLWLGATLHSLSKSDLSNEVLAGSEAARAAMRSKAFRRTSRAMML